MSWYYKREKRLYYVSLNINDDFLLGVFIYTNAASDAEYEAKKTVNNKYDFAPESIKINFIRNLSSFSLIEICTRILKIDLKYTSFLSNKYDIDYESLFNETLAQDIKKLIMPGNLSKKIEMVSRNNGYIQLIYKPHIEIQKKITDVKYILYIDNPDIEFVKSAIATLGASFVANNVDFICKFQDECFDTYKKALIDEYVTFKLHNLESHWSKESLINTILSSNLKMKFKIFTIKELKFDLYTILKELDQPLVESLFSNEEFISFILKDKFIDSVFNYSDLAASYVRSYFKKINCNLKLELFFEHSVNWCKVCGKPKLEDNIEEYINCCNIDSNEDIKKMIIKLPSYLNYSNTFIQHIKTLYLKLNNEDKIDLFIKIFKYSEKHTGFYIDIIEDCINYLKNNIDDYFNNWWDFISFGNGKYDVLFEKYSTFSAEETSLVCKKLRQDNFSHINLPTDYNLHPVCSSYHTKETLNLSNLIKIEIEEYYESHTNFGWSGDNEWTTEEHWESFKIFVLGNEFRIDHYFLYENDIKIAKFIILLCKYYNIEL